MALGQIFMIASMLSGARSAEIAPDADIGYNLLVTEPGPDVPRTCFKVPNLPVSVNGSFFISGPAKFEMGGYTFKSFFDGYGRINRFEMDAGQVCFTAKLLNSTYLLDAEKLGRISNGPTFYGTEPPLPSCPLKDPLCFLKGVTNDNNWVNILPVKGEGLMVTDSPMFVRLNYDTLTVTAGNYPWKDTVPHSGGMMPGFMKAGHVATSGSAHPLRRPKTDSTYVEVITELSLLPFSKSMQAVYTIDTSTMDRTLLAHVPSRYAQYLHSFGVSENYVVLPFNLKMKLPAHLGEDTTLVSAFADGWDGIHVVDLQGNVQIFQTDPFYHVHIANTFENATGIVMDLGTWDSIPFSAHALATAQFINKTARDERNFGLYVERLHLHLAGPQKGSVTREKVSVPGRLTDFFKINDAMAGLPYCIYYAVEWTHDDKSYANMAILKHDMCSNTKTYWAKEHTYPGEPFFVATGNGEDEGLLVFVALDGPRGASDFVILDAKTFKEVAIVQLPVHIPFTAHGQFIPKAAKEAVRAAVEIEDPTLIAAIGSTFQI